MNDLGWGLEWQKVKCIQELLWLERLELKWSIIRFKFRREVSEGFYELRKQNSGIIEGYKEGEVFSGKIFIYKK